MFVVLFVDVYFAGIRFVDCYKADDAGSSIGRSVSISLSVLFGVTLRRFLSGDDGSGLDWLMMSCSSAANRWLNNSVDTNAESDLIPSIIAWVDWD